VKLHEVVERTGLEVKAAAEQLGAEVTGGYVGDLLSAVMANAREGDLWITWHVHPNIVAVGLVAKLAGVVLACGREPEEETIRKAQEEGLPILVSQLPAFEIVGRLHEMGISGAR
jgi:hypothetical protein